MFRGIFVAACLQNLCQSYLVTVIVNFTLWINLILWTFLLITLDETRNKFAKEKSATITQDGSILLSSVCLYSQLWFVNHAALEHNCAWLVDRDLLVSKSGIKVGDTAVGILNNLFTSAWVYLADIWLQFPIQIFLDFRLEEVLVDESNRLRHRLNHLPVWVDYSLVFDLYLSCTHVEHHTEILHIVSLVYVKFFYHSRFIFVFEGR